MNNQAGLPARRAPSAARARRSPCREGVRAEAGARAGASHVGRLCGCQYVSPGDQVRKKLPREETAT